MNHQLLVKVFALVLRSAVLILNGLCLSYIYKLEKIGCPCAESPYRRFLKGYMTFAIAYLFCSIIVTGSISPDALSGFLKKGSPMALGFIVIDIVFTVATVTFFIQSISYVRRLVQEKCECSNDVRRDVMYYWSVIQLTLIAILVLLPLALTIVLGAVGFFQSTFSPKQLMNYKKEVESIVIDPIGSIKRAPRAVRGQMKRLTK